MSSTKWDSKFNDTLFISLAEADVIALANKLDASTERQNLSEYRDVLIEFNQTKCFYCGRELRNASGSSSPVDHFIPWTFVKDDKLWNFVLACPHCNSSKSNILPDRQYFEEMWHSAVFNGFESGWRV